MTGLGQFSRIFDDLLWSVLDFLAPRDVVALLRCSHELERKGPRPLKQLDTAGLDRIVTEGNNAKAFICAHDLILHTTSVDKGLRIGGLSCDFRAHQSAPAASYYAKYCMLSQARAQWQQARDAHAFIYHDFISSGPLRHNAVNLLIQRSPNVAELPSRQWYEDSKHAYNKYARNTLRGGIRAHLNRLRPVLFRRPFG